MGRRAVRPTEHLLLVLSASGLCASHQQRVHDPWDCTLCKYGVVRAGRFTR